MADPRTTLASRRLELLSLLGLPNAAPDPDFDRLARIAASVTGWGCALVAFLDAEHAWFAARTGFDAARLPLADTFCAATLDEPRRLEVFDARANPRFAGHALVAGPQGVRAYAGQPIVFEEVVLGTVCVMDTVPRTLSDAQRAALADLAGTVAGLLEQRRQRALLHEERGHALALAAALRDSEARLAAAQQLARMGSWERDLQAGTFTCSDGCYGLLGLDPRGAPLDAAALAAMVHPDDQARFGAGLDRALAAGVAAHAEFRVLRADGHVAWMNALTEPVRDAQGRFVRLRGTIQDVTARKHAEAQARESAERYRRIVQTAEEGIWLIDAGNVTTFVNPKMAHLLGYTVDEMAGRSLFEFMDDAARAQAEANVERRARGIAEQHDFRLRRRDGSELWTAMSTSPIFDDAGRYAGALAMVTDITERRRGEEALRRSEARFRSLSALSADWYWELDADLRLVEVVGGPSSRRDIRARSRVGQHPWEDADAGVDPAVWARHRAQLEAHEPFRDFEIQADGGPDGVRQVLTISGEPVFDDAGRFAGYRGVGRNITEQRRARHAREQLEAQLREAQKMEAIGVLAGGIAHDFNNVVAGILGNVSLALQDLPPGHPAAQSLAQIRKAGLRGRGLVQQILAFARRQPPEVAPCELHPLVDESVDLLRAMLPAGVQIEAEIAGEPLHVLADATQVGQVLMNLCTNAWHALSGSTGRIVVGLHPAQLDAAAARRIAAGLAAGRYACLSVRDDGRGMNAETRARIFEPFFTTKPVGEGTGLGLSVAHGIVAAHGGAIAVESAEGAGSTFSIYLPCAVAPEPARDGPKADPAALRGRGERVLYVDDDEVMAVMVESLLQRLGYDVVCHQDPQAALAAVRARPDAFDVAVTDLNMPGLSGLDVAREIARVRGDLPVIISSGNLPEELQADARSAGVRALLHKQYTLEELGPAIHRVLADGRPHEAAPLRHAGSRLQG
jgi:PAS domain S-box-containing protein